MANEQLGWEAPSHVKGTKVVDPRAVGNTEQVEAMLTGVGYAGPNGPRYVAFLGCMYYGMMRLEEVAALKESQCELPAEGWGKLVLDGAVTTISDQWTDTRRQGDQRPLKHREEGDIRVIPIQPRLVELLRAHLDEFGTAKDGRLFQTVTGKVVADYTINRTWHRARKFAMPPAVRGGLLLHRPYNLRHSGVSLRLYAGVPPKQVAEWAGHSEQMLHKIYSKVLAGYDTQWQARIDAFMTDTKPTSTARPSDPPTVA